MCLDTVKDRPAKSVERKIDTAGSEQSLLTPARRAALDALEREFQDLLRLVAR
jgi:hypothetical protein